MKTIFQSEEHSQLVEKGMTNGEDEVKQKKSKKKDAKALCLIQQAVDGSILDRIAKAKIAHDAWDIVKKQCQGFSKMMMMRKQELR